MSARDKASLSDLAKSVLPSHVAIVMDGNGRWARQRGLPRVMGHKRGVDVVRDIVEASSELGIRYLTLYTFSLENWNRPQLEIQAIMRFLANALKRQTLELNENNVRLETIGQIHRLPASIQKQLLESKKVLAANTGLTLVLALSYGSRAEIVDAARQIAVQVQSGELDAIDIDESCFTNHLNTAKIPDPELLIRTSGELRMSNFLLWQASYSELVFTPTLWPDFTPASLVEAIEEYARRDRRFGKV